jgi:hypothetical protein
LGTAFFENWRDSLKWQRLMPYEKFAEMIDRHGMESAPTASLTTRSRSASWAGHEEYVRLNIHTHNAK